MNSQLSRAASEAVGAPSPCPTSSAAVSSQAQFEGESSFSAHTAFANSLIERAVSTTPLETFSPEMATTLHALRRLVETQNNESYGFETTYRLARSDPSSVLSLDQNPMPPVQSVMSVLQLMKSKHPSLPTKNAKYFLSILTRALQRTRSSIALGSTCT
jgi:hypothetical protein